ncbi:4-hydroxythreonine-4-phosphate dehydrogenase PdxA [Legionella anisa]|uniref:4-hydroxythreonine-4-phosphate dehydrogenase n=1 Tax=Legionella anisa TaxID=28082 RepID=A0AAX0WPV7_9GAMM|nr:4-hydroxythreonine-4-phosphate dehydrogenase PdxA [Legionella anisa]AWN75513.1 4-hydroxythreonine-4-phosphate dehydrogenase PdxA [Legionella anisa]KTC76299.1 4-hydroxythreonine-4-phosphate dehydrogenase [Legionella anisa]MBN5937113.1 4-hydroxythreonine-4-phosphate dehydrogenase PdxA [Legionella anisa]MCW8424297.1 4-hydroxythreonine-4-phosphate dehydrogenase PdxA [Legionella anisa]MCW8446585.1 4-hydroxythreonine-4-phosphate dehydrogenase PdxA [Legionella anisa]
MKPLLISSGEPAGIGPDLCLALAKYDFPLVILGDQAVLEARAKELNRTIYFTPYQSGQDIKPKHDHLTVLSVTCPDPVQSGCLNPKNAAYVIELLNQAAALCGRGEFSGLITAPVHKANINEAGIPFSGHTEFFAQFYKKDVVMMLACNEMKVALVTTHLPLRRVPDAITSELIIKVITQVHQSLIRDFNIKEPCIKVAGLNPHAGESGYLGREEIEVITPTIMHLQQQGINVQGPMPADTLFIKSHLQNCDAYVAMYHDQGLPVIKYADFHNAVNVTLGLPIIRTSVDHGTALELAGKNLLDPGSMFAAVDMAKTMTISRMRS